MDKNSIKHLVAIFIIRWVNNEEEFYVKYNINRPELGFKEQLQKNFQDSDPKNYDKACQKMTETKRKEDVDEKVR